MALGLLLGCSRTETTSKKPEDFKVPQRHGAPEQFAPFGLEPDSAWRLSTDSIMKRTDFYKGGWKVSLKGLWTYTRKVQKPPLISQALSFDTRNRLSAYKFYYVPEAFDSLCSLNIRTHGEPVSAGAGTLFTWNTTRSRIDLIKNPDRTVLSCSKR